MVMTLPQREDVIEVIKRIDTLFKYAVQYGEVETEREGE